MKQKTIFFDIDGTLLTTRNGRPFQIPQSTLFALDALKRAGHRVAICSGRQEPFIRRFFPGIFGSFVAMNGAHVVFEGHTVYDSSFSPARLRALAEHFDAFGCRYIFVGKHHGWAHRVPAPLYAPLNAAYGLPDFLREYQRPEEVDAGSMDFYFADEDEFQRQKDAFRGEMVLNRHPGTLTADLSFPGHNKAKGIERLLAYAGIPKEDTVAFGDGYNDVSMMGAVGCGVAMGNAVEEVKRAADYVTAEIFDDGILKAVRHLGLIE